MELRGWYLNAIRYVLSCSMDFRASDEDNMLLGDFRLKGSARGVAV